MGQYFKGTKIGTCENMYWLRLSQARRLADLGLCDDDKIEFSEYLKDGETRFRFPFPSEDSMEDDRVMGNVLDHVKNFDIPVGDVVVNHKSIVVSNTQNSGGYNINIFLPCPHSSEFKALGLGVSHSGVGEQFLSVRYQAMRCVVDGGELKEKTIFACARCNGEQYFSDEDVEAIKKRAIEHFSVYNCEGKNPGYSGNQGLYDNAMKIIERIK